jgi:SEC-C motif-containing protein
MAKKYSNAQKVENIICPCESGKPYQTCCEPYHSGISAPTAEALMRSRYTAYTLSLEAYLLQTWHPDTRPAELNLDEDQSMQWIGLQIKQVKTSGDKASVNFVARYKVNGKAHKLCELSQFVRIGNIWLYLSGTDPNTESKTTN